MLENRPLYPTRADWQRYAPTAEQDRAAELVGRGRNTLIVGERGAGKSTTLRMIEYERRESRAPVAYVSLAQAADVAHAAVALHRAAAERGWVNDDEARRERVLRLLEDPFAPNQLIGDLSGSPRDAVFLVDDVTGEIGHALFGRMRDELWQLERTWGVAADASEAALLTIPPADAFFESRVELRQFNSAERQDFLARRMSKTPLDERFLQLAIEGPGNPRKLLSAARSIEDFSASASDVIQGVERRRQRAGDVAGRPAEMLVAELENLGPVSAGDPELLERLGWTRPRAVELLNQLERAGIVVSRLERQTGPGRPRKVYELRSELEFIPR